MLHAHDPSKDNASPSDTGKALASQAVLSYPDVGQESAWRQIALVVDILSACTGEDHKRWKHTEGSVHRVVAYTLLQSCDGVDENSERAADNDLAKHIALYNLSTRSHRIGISLLL
jgi:hypothetical protein